MRKASLAEVAIKVWALFLLVTSALALPTFIAKLAVVGAQTFGTFEFFDFAITVGVALALFAFARRIAKWMAGAETDDGGGETWTPSLQSVGFGCVGLFFAVRGLRDCAELLVELAVKPGTESYIWQGAASQLAGPIVEIVAGVVIFLARGRAAGQKRYDT
jgi:hypothetical protein